MIRITQMATWALQDRKKHGMTVAVVFRHNHTVEFLASGKNLMDGVRKAFRRSGYGGDVKKPLRNKDADRSLSHGA
jgi:hypothetical protein